MTSIPDRVPARRRRSSLALPLALMGAVVALSGCNRGDDRAEADSGDFDADTTSTVTSGTRTRRYYERRRSHGWFGSMFGSSYHDGPSVGRSTVAGAAAGGAMGFVAGNAASRSSGGGSGAVGGTGSGGTSRGGFGGGFSSGG